jgi:hypothetical protein
VKGPLYEIEALQRKVSAGTHIIESLISWTVYFHLTASSLVSLDKSAALTNLSFVSLSSLYKVVFLIIIASV